MHLPVIVNPNDFYLYFEMFRQTEARRVLDYGMFLRRIGAVARQTGDLSMPDGVFLTGVAPEQTGGVYEVLYDRILNPAQLLESRDESYDLAFLLRVADFMSAGEMIRLWRWLERHTTWLVMEEAGAERFLQICLRQCGKRPRTERITVEQDSYLFLAAPFVPGGMKSE